MDGIERIKILASEIIDEDLKKITDYLITRKDMNEKYLNEEKSFKQMVEFINDIAYKELSKKKQSGFKGYHVCDETVYGWAIHYWDESNESLGLNKIPQAKIQEAELAKDEESTKVRKVEQKKSIKKEWIPEGQLSLF